jgi:hypothetical protein
MPASCQAGFHARWGHLQDPHVRDLAWLLDAPDLLDPTAPQWHGRIASLPELATDTARWLAELDRMPAPLHEWLALRPMARLGRYAEKLLAFHFHREGALAAHGLQVRAGDQTVGEFDFLLRRPGGLEHWEFAAKLYLLQADASPGTDIGADYFVGPNLADTLGAKMDKILNRQLALAAHPAAAAVLPGPVTRSCAFIKGWLFYHRGAAQSTVAGLHPAHCRGWWSALNEFCGRGANPALRYRILPRLSWLAPGRVDPADALDAAALAAAAQIHFAHDTMPLMAGIYDEEGLEIEREFLVPDDWQERARHRAHGNSG